MKSESLNFLETSGPLQACNGTALTLHIIIIIIIIITVRRKLKNRMKIGRPPGV